MKFKLNNNKIIIIILILKHKNHKKSNKILNNNKLFRIFHQMKQKALKSIKKHNQVQRKAII